MVALLNQSYADAGSLQEKVAALVVGEVVADEALLNPCLVLMEGAGAARGGSGGEISTLAVAAEVATDGGGSNVERVCGFLLGL